MRKNNKGREDTLLAKIYGSNLSFQGQIHRFKKLDGLGRARTREGGGRNKSSLSKGNLAVGFEFMLDARIHGSELGAEIHGSEVKATDLSSELGAMCSGAEHRLKTQSQASLTDAALISSSPSWFLPLPNPSNLLNRRI